MNSCCFFFSLERGTVLIQLYEFVWLIVKYINLGSWYMFFRHESEDFAWLLKMAGILKNLFLVASILNLISFYLFHLARNLKAGKFLIPYLTLKIILKIFDAAFWFLTLLFYMNTIWMDFPPVTRNFVVVYYIVAVCTLESFSVYSWMVAYNYYKQLNEKRVGESPSGSQPRAPRGRASPAKNETPSEDGDSPPGDGNDNIVPKVQSNIFLLRL